MIWKRIKDLLILFIEFLDKVKEIDYSFIPDEWNKVKGDITTTKTMQDNIPVAWDVRDLFNSTVYSRRWADIIITLTGSKGIDTTDEYFNRLVLEAANYVISNIEYKSNKSQFNVSDRWNNGDTAIVTLYGDCDISVRVFVRIMLDALEKLKMYEHKKYVFQVVGLYGINDRIGHSWGMVYDPVNKEFKAVECTEDTAYANLPKVPHYYNMWFCLNYKNIWFQNSSWKCFL